jgi:hypothetical protein
MSRWIVSAGVVFAFWALWGLVSLEWSVDGHAWWAELLFYGFTLLLPTVVIGVLVDRWWAPGLALSLLALPLVPGRCVWRQSGDVFGGVCSDSSEELLLQPSVAFGALLAGTVLAVARREFTNRRWQPSG